MHMGRSIERPYGESMMLARAVPTLPGAVRGIGQLGGFQGWPHAVEVCPLPPIRAYGKIEAGMFAEKNMALPRSCRYG